MNRLVLGLLLSSLAAPVAAQTYTLDDPIPSDLYDRTYLSSADVAGVRKNMEKVVGYFAFIRANGKVQVTGLKPQSATAADLARVQVTGDKPAYDSVVTKTAEIGAALPMIGFTLTSNQRAQVTMVDVAQFTSDRDPTADDFKNLPAVNNGGHWAYISAATVSTVQVTVMEEKGGGLDGLLQAIKIGAKTYQAKNKASNTLAVALFLKPDPVWVATAPSPTTNAARAEVLQSVGLTAKPANALATEQ